MTACRHGSGTRTCQGSATAGEDRRTVLPQPLGVVLTQVGRWLQHLRTASGSGQPGKRHRTHAGDGMVGKNLQMPHLRVLWQFVGPASRGKQNVMTRPQLSPVSKRALRNARTQRLVELHGAMTPATARMQTGIS